MGRRRPLRDARYAGSFPSQYVQVEGPRISLRLFKRSENCSTACCVRNWITTNRRKIGRRTDARKLAGHGLDVCYASIRDSGLSPIFSSGGCLHWVVSGRRVRDQDGVSAMAVNGQEQTFPNVAGNEPAEGKSG